MTVNESIIDIVYMCRVTFFNTLRPMDAHIRQ